MQYIIYFFKFNSLSNRIYWNLNVHEYSIVYSIWLWLGPFFFKFSSRWRWLSLFWSSSPWCSVLPQRLTDAGWSTVRLSARELLCLLRHIIFFEKRHNPHCEINSQTSPTSKLCFCKWLCVKTRARLRILFRYKVITFEKLLFYLWEKRLLMQFWFLQKKKSNISLKKSLKRNKQTTNKQGW